MRRLLIEELRKSAAAPKAEEEVRYVGFTGIMKKTEETAVLLQKRLTDLRSGVHAVPEYLPTAFEHFKTRGRTDIFLMFTALLILLAAGWGAEGLFRRYTHVMREQIEAVPCMLWSAKLKYAVLRAFIDLASVSIFIITNLVLFFLFFDHGGFQRLILLTYLAVVLLVRGINLVSRFVFAPTAPAIRILPLSDSTALYLHRWIGIVSATLGIGLLVRSLLELQHVDEVLVLVVRALVGMIVLSMILFLIFENRGKITRALREDSSDGPEGAPWRRFQIAEFWPLLVVPYIAVLWGLWVFYLLLGRADAILPILALLLIVPLFILLNRLGQKLLDASFGLVHPPEGMVEEVCSSTTTHESESVSVKEQDKKVCKDRLDISRFTSFLRRLLSFSIGGLLFFWLLHLWGFDVPVGERVITASFRILVAVVFSYVAWKMIESAINRKLATVRDSMGFDEDEHEMGGAGGSRIGTLLTLLRKFLLVVLLIMTSLIALSAVGINIGPLLAGASVIGIAIGFGSQTLVKDIVSGIFFLMDDAFRIGDYIESGSSKGTVEHISIRSLRLRHPRGQIHTVPFGDLGSVTNYSRDYIIEKLPFRVPYDTNIDKVRKIVKKMNQEIESDPEMGSKLLGPIKFQGVRQLDESAMVMRIKFKTKPGEQFIIRREVYARLQKAFEKQGLEFAHRHVVVRLPHEPLPTTPPASQTDSSATPPTPVSPEKQLLTAGAAAAIAAALIEEDEKKAAAEKDRI